MKAQTTEKKTGTKKVKFVAKKIDIPVPIENKEDNNVDEETTVVEEVKPKKELPKRVIGIISIKNKMYQLLVGEDKKFYKCAMVGEVQYDKLHNSPILPVWDEEFKPLAKTDI